MILTRTRITKKMDENNLKIKCCPPTCSRVGRTAVDPSPRRSSKVMIDDDEGRIAVYSLRVSTSEALPTKYRSTTDQATSSLHVQYCDLKHAKRLLRAWRNPCVTPHEQAVTCIPCVIGPKRSSWMTLLPERMVALKYPQIVNGVSSRSVYSHILHLQLVITLNNNNTKKILFLMNEKIIQGTSIEECLSCTVQ